MRKYSIITKTCAALATILLAVFAFGGEHSQLNGTWTLVPTKSEFAGQPVIQTGSVTIKDRDGITIIERSFVYDGVGETYFYNDSLGNEHNGTIHAAKDLKTKTKWEHDVLKVTTTHSGAVILESYSLTADGTMLVTVEKPERKPITLVFTRK